MCNDIIFLASEYVIITLASMDIVLERLQIQCVQGEYRLLHTKNSTLSLHSPWTHCIYRGKWVKNI